MNEPRFEVFPERVDSGHETFVMAGPAFHPSGDEYTVADAYCDSCDWTDRGEEVEVRNAAFSHEFEDAFCWHFKDSNAHITFTGGESFTRREDAHRSIEGVVFDVGVLLPGVSKLRFRDGVLIDSSGQRRYVPIDYLDENGDAIRDLAAPSSDS